MTDTKSIRMVYQCGGGTGENFVHYIAIAFHNAKTEYIVRDMSKTVKQQVNEFIKNKAK